MSSANIAIVRRLFEEFFNCQDMSVADELLSLNYQHHNPSLPSSMQDGREGYKMLVHGYFCAFPDFTVSLEEIFSMGNMVSARWLWSGTQEGDLNGIPPTGEEVSIPTMGMFRIENEQIVEGWVVFDTFGLMSQLGVITEDDDDEMETELVH